MKRLWMIVLIAGIARGADVTAWITGEEVLINAVRWSATQQATQMFDAIGVSLEWAKARPSVSEGAQIEVRFTTHTAWPKPGALAFSTPFDPKPVVTVLYDRIVFLTTANPGNRARLLAHVLAHEFGHVLMRSTAHSCDGVMKTQWTLLDHQRMVYRPLPFLPSDAQAIRDSLATFAARK